MYRFLLSPRWIAAHVVMIAAVAVCLILGSWQGDAFRESKARHDARDQAPVPFAELVTAPDDIDAAVDRAVTLRGEFDPSAQVLVPGRVHNDTLGSYVVTIFRGESGIDVPVVRGWLDASDDPETQAPSGPATITGHLLPPEPEGKAVVRSDRPLEDNQVGYIAPEVISDAVSMSTEARLLRGFVVLNEAQPQPAAAPVDLRIGDIDPIRDVNPWQNASYWAQWWVFALAAVVFWASAIRAAVRSRRSATISEPDRAPAPS